MRNDPHLATETEGTTNTDMEGATKSPPRKTQLSAYLPDNSELVAIRTVATVVSIVVRILQGTAVTITDQALYKLRSTVSESHPQPQSAPQKRGCRVGRKSFMFRSIGRSPRAQDTVDRGRLEMELTISSVKLCSTA